MSQQIDFKFYYRQILNQYIKNPAYIEQYSLPHLTFTFIIFYRQLKTQDLTASSAYRPVIGAQVAISVLDSVARRSVPCLTSLVICKLVFQV